MLLTAAQAAAWLGISVGQFRRAVKRGEYPPAKFRGRPFKWDIRQLDVSAGRVNVPSDPLMEHLLGYQNALR
jgi:hypothetical protein